MTRIVFKLEFPIVVILDNIWHVRRTPDREESVSLKLKYYTGFSLNSQENTKMGGGVAGVRSVIAMICLLPIM